MSSPSFPRSWRHSWRISKSVRPAVLRATSKRRPSESNPGLAEDTYPRCKIFATSPSSSLFLLRARRRRHLKQHRYVRVASLIDDGNVGAIGHLVVDI